MVDLWYNLIYTKNILKYHKSNWSFKHITLVKKRLKESGFIKFSVISPRINLTLHNRNDIKIFDLNATD